AAVEPIKFRCPACQRMLKFAADQGGRPFCCQWCSAPGVVPGDGRPSGSTETSIKAADPPKPHSPASSSKLRALTEWLIAQANPPRPRYNTDEEESAEDEEEEAPAPPESPRRRACKAAVLVALGASLCAGGLVFDSWRIVAAVVALVALFYALLPAWF